MDYNGSKLHPGGHLAMASFFTKNIGIVNRVDVNSRLSSIKEYIEVQNQSRMAGSLLDAYFFQFLQN